MIRKSKSRIVFEIFLYIFLAIAGLICFYPIWEVFVTSIIPYGEYMKSNIHIFPRAFTTSAYRIIFRQPNVIGSLLNSIYITVFGTFLSLVITIPTAYVLSKSYLKGQRLFLFLFYFTVLFEGGIIPLYFVVRKLGMVNTLWALMIPQLIFVYYMIIMRSFFVSFPSSLEEAAKIEGYNDIKILLYIVIPLSKPVIAAIGLFYAVLRWNDFFQAMLFISKRAKWPLQLLVHHLTSPDTNLDASGALLAMGPDKGVSVPTVNMAAVVIAVVPIILVYPFIQRYFSKGLLIGSLKE
jgi:putative aldouronate transport system permease protein